MGRNIVCAWLSAIGLAVLAACAEVPSQPTAVAGPAGAQVVTYRAPDTAIDVRFPLPDGICLADPTSEQGRLFIAAHQREGANLVAVYLPCSGQGYALQPLGEGPGQIRHGVIRWNSSIYPLPPGQLATLPAQQLANLVISGSAVPKRSDITNWDAELRALAPQLIEGVFFEFALAPDDQNGNYQVSVGRAAYDVSVLGVDSVLGLKRQLFYVGEFYSEFDRAQLSVADVLAERRRWNKTVQDANRE
jgi:hypothetical protein